MSRSRARADRTETSLPLSYDGACARCELDLDVDDLDLDLDLDFDFEDDLAFAPEPELAPKLRRAGLDYSLAFARWFAPACALGDPLALEARASALALGPKVARLSALLAIDGSVGFEPIVADDAHATLSLIWQLDRVCERATCGVATTDQRHASAARAARQALLDLLAPFGGPECD